eukprot:2488934-Prymnesium_polylepis.1
MTAHRRASHDGADARGRVVHLARDVDAARALRPRLLQLQARLERLAQLPLARELPLELLDGRRRVVQPQ